MEQRFAAELDMAAEQMEGLGYKVARLPLDDHPVRSPANMLRFRDSQGRPACMLPVFPSHLPAGSPDAMQNRIQEAVKQNAQSLAAWQAAPSEAGYKAVLAATHATLRLLKESLSLSNPCAEAQLKALRASGIRVIPIPGFVWGAGSLHCQSFH